MKNQTLTGTGNRLSKKLQEKKDTFITPWWPVQADYMLAFKDEQIVSFSEDFLGYEAKNFFIRVFIW